MTFKIKKTGASYRIDLSEKEAEALLDYCNSTYDEALVAVLESINGVSNVDSNFGVHLYQDGYSGTNIFLTISIEEDNETTWNKIFEAINKAIRG